METRAKRQQACSAREVIDKPKTVSDAYNIKNQCLKWNDKYVKILTKDPIVPKEPVSKEGRVTKDGIYTFLVTESGKLWTAPVESITEYGSLHDTMVYESKATSVLYAGELRKTGKEIEFNLQSGTYMKSFLSDHPDCEEYLKKETTEVLEKAHPEADVQFVEETLVTPANIPLTKEDLDKFHGLGFEIRLYKDRNVCKANPVMLDAQLTAATRQATYAQSKGMPVPVDTQAFITGLKKMMELHSSNYELYNSKMPTLSTVPMPKGGRRTRRWIQGVTKTMKRGAFTRQALRSHKTPEQYADSVLAHPKRHSKVTLRRARFLKNIRR
uniref:Uncharacterized protein n=1 Tax=viral metagenome TaxID=1070528 RepID=A0A6C0J2N4_9ZZZZ